MGHNLDQRHAAAIEVQIRVPVALTDVEGLTGVFLEVNADDPDGVLSAVIFIDQLAIGCQRLLVLRDLIALGQIGIEVVLARENRAALDRAR